MTAKYVVKVIKGLYHRTANERLYEEGETFIVNTKYGLYELYYWVDGENQRLGDHILTVVEEDID